MLGRVGILVLVVQLAAGAVSAAPLQRRDVPEPLQPWVDWALRGHEDAQCTLFEGDAERRQCAWPSRLGLTLDEHGGTFTQQWDMQRALWTDLPGAAKLWPQDVVVDGAPALVIEQGGVPRVWLERGRHMLSGRFAWDRLPEMLRVPAATGLIALSVRGQTVLFPNRDGEGRLWLRREEAANESNQVEVHVFRLVDDDSPLRLTTRIQLAVSGKGREVLLGPALPERFVPMALDSPLPARLEADGRLRLQVRAGRWQLQITARHDGPAAALSARPPSEAWDASEVWVFQAHPDLRLVSIEGADGIDPQQTDLPPDWRTFPAYLMRPGATMQLVERRRGDADPAPDQLTLRRTLWLDFDGGGYTLRDQITGTLARGWRLDMAPPTVLGRVAVDGADQFITRLSATAMAGVEIRSREVRLDADSRLDGAGRDLPAVGWDEDFQQLSGQLQLPPGWRLVYAGGVDGAKPTWVGAWTLLDLFAVLITALATARLFGLGWGALALCAVGLSYTEPNAPQWVWLMVLAAEALVRAVPAGRAHRLVQLARLAALAALVILTVPFLVGQIRQGLYPALEHADQSMDVEGAQAPAAAPARLREEMAAGGARDVDAMKRGYLSNSSRSVQSYVDPRAVVQTGPGLPGWQWNAVALEWSGPVTRTQHLRLVLLPPWMNLLLAVARTLLLALLVARLVRSRPAVAAIGANAAVLLIAGVMASAIVAAPAARADFPSTDLLDELRTRLLAPPDCHPACASFPRLRLEIEADVLRARLQIDVGAATAVPLPGNAQQWLPRTVIVDGAPGTAVLLQGADGVLWLQLDAGVHQVLLEGPLPARDTVQLLLPMGPHQVEAQVSGWTVDGLHENGVADASLQLSRLAPAEGGAAAPLQANQLPPFARIERTLHLPLTWQVETRVVRLTPSDAALLLEVPLLPGESLTTAEVRVVDGRAQINLPPHAAEASWQSTLAESSPISLRAPDAVPWVEVWRLDASPLWHVEASGIAPVHRADADAAPLREWRPWPGEVVAFDVTRPEGVPGQTLTVDSSDLSVSPGVRATDVTLSVALRSSRGAQHPIILPDGAELQSVAIDGATQPIRQEGRRVVLPINPGAQRVELRWREPDGVRARLRSPTVDLGAASVDAHLQIAMPPSRWIVLVGGPRLGPAILFWSLLPVVLLAALGLARVRGTPLRARHWFLLGVGLTQVHVGLAAVVVGWLLALSWRRERGGQLGTRGFDLLQILLAGWSLAALAILFAAIQQGLLGLPEMQVAGNGSSAALLRWYQDRATAVLPQAWVVSVPLLVYRLLMLAWALWIAQALLQWLRWGWECFGGGGYWRPLWHRAATST